MYTIVGKLSYFLALVYTCLWIIHDFLMSRYRAILVSVCMSTGWYKVIVVMGISQLRLGGRGFCGRANVKDHDGAGIC